MKEADIGRAAAQLLEARQSGELIPGLPDELRPATLAEAYRIQAAAAPAILAAAGGGEIVGRKIGCTNPTAQALMSLSEPFHGLLLSPFVARGPLEIAADRFSMRLLEPEIAFRMGADLPAGGAPYDANSVKQAIATVMGAIEIVDTRYATFASAGGLQLIADNGSTGHWLHGAESEDVDGIDYANHAVSFSLNGEIREQGKAGNTLGSSLNALAWLANDLARSGQGLEAGQLITTGTATAVVAAEAGDIGLADFGSLGQVEVRFT